jgi:hypothetical protein
MVYFSRASRGDPPIEPVMRLSTAAPIQCDGMVLHHLQYTGCRAKQEEQEVYALRNHATVIVIIDAAFKETASSI